MCLPGTQRAGVGGEISSAHPSGVSLSSLPNQRLCVAPAEVSCGHDPLNIPPHPLAGARAGRDPSPCPCSLATSTPGGTARTREVSWDLGPGSPVCSQPAGEVCWNFESYQQGRWPAIATGAPVRSRKQKLNYFVYVNCLLKQAFGNPNGFLHAGV